MKLFIAMAASDPLETIFDEIRDLPIVRELGIDLSRKGEDIVLKLHKDYKHMELRVHSWRQQADQNNIMISWEQVENNGHPHTYHKRVTPMSAASRVENILQAYGEA